MNTLEQLKRELADAVQAKEMAVGAVERASRAYAQAKAEVIGVKVGSIVTVTQSRGWGVRQKTVTSRIRVHRIRDGYSFRNNGLKLWGRVIRKDGTEGALREIYHDWTVEQP